MGVLTWELSHGSGAVVPSGFPQAQGSFPAACFLSERQHERVTPSASETKGKNTFTAVGFAGALVLLRGKQGSESARFSLGEKLPCRAKRGRVCTWPPERRERFLLECLKALVIPWARVSSSIFPTGHKGMQLLKKCQISMMATRETTRQWAHRCSGYLSSSPLTLTGRGLSLGPGHSTELALPLFCHS